MEILHQTTRAGLLPAWLELPEPIFESIIQHLYDSTSNRQDVLHALLVCKRWAAAAGTLAYALDLTYSGSSLAYDLPGVAWLLRRSKQVVKLSLRGDSGAACGTLQALQWDHLLEMELQAPEDSFGLEVFGEVSQIDEAMRGQGRAQIIESRVEGFYLVATRPWDALPATERLPCLERLACSGYALLSWRFPDTLRELELVMPTSGRDQEDTDGIMWAGEVGLLRPLPALEKLRLELPLCEVDSLASCFGGDETISQPRHRKVWPSLQHLDITMLHRDCAIERPVFSVASLPLLQSLVFASQIVHEDEWNALFAKGEVWPHMQQMAVESNVGVRLSAAMFPAAKLTINSPRLVPEDED